MERKHGINREKDNAMIVNQFNKRIEWLDVAKGIVILFMILGHTGLPLRLSNIIFAFHMPFFFVASGLTTNFTKYPIGSFCYKKLKSLGIPFVIYSLINLILWPIAKKETYHSFIINFMEDGWGGVALWFIPVLFFALFMARIVYLIKDDKIRNTVTVLLPFLSGILCFYKLHLPWNLSVVPLATFFVLAGDYCKRFLDTLYSLDKPKWYWFILSLVVMLVVSQMWRLDMAFNSVLPIVPKIVAALCGCYCVEKVSVFIAKKMGYVSKIFKEIGKETYIILAFSQIIIFSSNAFFKIGIAPKYALMVVILVSIVGVKNILTNIAKNKQ